MTGSLCVFFAGSLRTKSFFRTGRLWGVSAHGSAFFSLTPITQVITITSGMVSKNDPLRPRSRREMSNAFLALSMCGSYGAHQSSLCLVQRRGLWQ